MKSLISIALVVIVCGLGFVNLFVLSPGEFSSKIIGLSIMFIRDLYHPGISPILGVR